MVWTCQDSAQVSFHLSHPPIQALLRVPGTQNQSGASHTSCSHREWRLLSTNMGQEAGGWHKPAPQHLSKYLDENRPGFSPLTCIHFMFNGKSKHFICLLLQALREWFLYLLPKVQAAINCFALSWCLMRMVNLDLISVQVTQCHLPSKVEFQVILQGGMK